MGMVSTVAVVVVDEAADVIGDVSLLHCQPLARDGLGELGSAAPARPVAVGPGEAVVQTLLIASEMEMPVLVHPFILEEAISG